MEHFKVISALILFTFMSVAYGANSEVSFYLFKGDLPAANIKVVIDGNKTLKTDTNGSLEIELAAGKHTVQIYHSEKEFKSVEFVAVTGEPTMINYTILENSKNLSSEVLSGAPAVEDKNIDLSKGSVMFSGVVKSSNKKSPLADVRVIVHGTNIESKTDANGKFEVALPLGEYNLSFMHHKFSTTTLNNMKFEENKNVVESVMMKPSGLELEEFVVLSPNLKSSVSALLEVRRGHQTVADLIGSEQISKSGDSDAGSSLRRVTGLSLVDGKYVYVRGLGERYSSTLLNDSMVPSPDPSRRVVPLDLFPASVIENMVVQKGYSPEMPAEFGGGVIQIKTKTLPAKRYFKFSVNRDFESNGTIKSYNGASKDWTGFDRGHRDMPELLKQTVREGKNVSALTVEQRRALGASINKSYNTREYTSEDRTSIPNFTISTGDKTRLGRVKVGYNISGLYSNKWTQDTEERQDFNSVRGELALDKSSRTIKSKNKVKLGALVGLGLQYKKHKLSYNGSLLRNTTNSVNETSGIDSEKEEYVQTNLIWKERSVQTHQVSGENQFRFLNKGKLNYNYTYSKALLEEPDNKMYTYKKTDGVFGLETENGSSSNTVSWREMPDRMRTMNVKYEQPFDLGPVKEGKFISGYSRMKRQRELTSNNFYYKFDGAGDLDASGTPDEVFAHPDGELYQQANETDNYDARQTINAYFGNMILPISKVTLTAGMRFEESIQEVDSFKLFSSNKTVSYLETRDYLPAVSATWKITPAMQLRANYSETISRPDLREISNTLWNDVDQGAKFVGNPNLQAAQITNWGVRWEWFYGRGEVLSLGYFRKRFEKPIEEIFGSLSADGRIVGTTETKYTFFNIDEATNEGIEFEFRKKLPWDFTLGGNYSWIKSDVSISESLAGQLTNFERPLQGQSPYLLNAQLDYEPKKWKGSFTLLYNTMGRRITGVGSDGRPDEYQQKISTLDLVASKSLVGGWKIKAKAKNLLNPLVERTQGTEVTRSTRKGRVYSLGLSATF